MTLETWNFKVSHPGNRGKESSGSEQPLMFYNFS